jgi:hypothetical protein
MDYIQQHQEPVHEKEHDPFELTLHELQKWYFEALNQPQFRKESNKACEYVDGNQFDAATLERYRQLGMGAIFENITRPPIDLLVGMEAKSRTDWRVAPDTEDWTDVAEVLSQKLYEAERESKADRACSDGFESAIKAGFGFVEVSRESNPFKYPYRCVAVHRNEITWDWTARDPMLEDAVWMKRQRWIDSKLVESWFPDKAELMHCATNGLWLNDNFLNNSLMQSEYAAMGRSTIPEYEWLHTATRKVCLSEVWYRRYVTKKVFKLPDGRAIEVDDDNQNHIALLDSGQIEVVEATFAKMRRAFWVGPLKLSDDWTPYRHNHFPYVPFFAYREDLTGIPYGVPRNIMPLQDEMNARRAKLMHNLGSRRVIRTSDAVKDVDMMRDEIARPDADIELDKDAMRAGGIFKVEADELTAQQFNVMNDARAAVQRVTSIYDQALGSQGNTSSGVAINSLVEQSSTTVAGLFDNHRFSRRMVGQLLLDLIREDLKGKEMVVTVGEDKPRDVAINQRVMQNGQMAIVNDVSSALVKVTLEDVSTSAAYRSQQQQFFAAALQGASPQAQAILYPYYFDTSELPHRKEIVKALKAAFGIADNEDPQAAKYQQVIQQLQQQMQQLQAALNDKQADRDLALKEIELKNQGAIELQQERNNTALADKDNQIQTLMTSMKQLGELIKEMDNNSPTQN